MNNTVKLLRHLGFHIYKYKFISKVMAFILSRWNMEVYWVIKEKDGYWVINCDNVDKLNRLNRLRNRKILRIRDLDNGALFRTPKRTWGKLKINSA